MQISVHFDIYTLIMNKSCFISLICTILAWFIVVHKSFNRAHYIFRTWNDRIAVDLLRICFSFVVFVVQIKKTPLKDIHLFGHTLLSSLWFEYRRILGIIYWSQIMKWCPFELCEIVYLRRKNLLAVVVSVDHDKTKEREQESEKKWTKNKTDWM